MYVNVIFTFEIGPQKFADYPFCSVLLKKTETYFEYLTSLLSEEEKKTLVKISTCIYYAKDLNPPEWFENMNGKYYDDVITKLMKKIWNIETTYEPINK